METKSPLWTVEYLIFMMKSMYSLVHFGLVGNHDKIVLYHIAFQALIKMVVIYYIQTTTANFYILYV